MSIKVQVQRRLAVSIAGLALASALVVGVAPVAAETDTQDLRDVNFHHEATDTPNDASLVITEIAAPTVVSNDGNVDPMQTPSVIGSRDDRSGDNVDRSHDNEDD